MEPPTNVKQIFDRMPASFQSGAAAGLDVEILFDITGEGGGKWRVAIKDGGLRVEEGPSEKPNLTITASAKDYLAISLGTLNEQLAFMTGRIRAKGDTLLAMKLPRLFKR
jgi:putative sterol carrier protein